MPDVIPKEELAVAKISRTSSPAGPILSFPSHSNHIKQHLLNGSAVLSSAVSSAPLNSRHPIAIAPQPHLGFSSSQYGAHPPSQPYIDGYTGFQNTVSALPPKPKKRGHSEVERKRRDRINDRINDLKNALPELKGQGPSSLNKTTILTVAVDHLKSLVTENRDLVEENSRLQQELCRLKHFVAELKDSSESNNSDGSHSGATNGEPTFVDSKQESGPSRSSNNMSGSPRRGGEDLWTSNVFNEYDGLENLDSLEDLLSMYSPQSPLHNNSNNPPPPPPQHPTTSGSLTNRNLQSMSGNNNNNAPRQSPGSDTSSNTGNDSKKSVDTAMTDANASEGSTVCRHSGSGSKSSDTDSRAENSSPNSTGQNGDQDSQGSISPDEGSRSRSNSTRSGKRSLTMTMLPTDPNVVSCKGYGDGSSSRLKNFLRSQNSSTDSDGNSSRGSSSEGKDSSKSVLSGTSVLNGHHHHHHHHHHANPRRMPADVQLAHMDLRQFLAVCLKTSMDCLVVASAKEASYPLTYVSDGFERLTGYKGHEVLGRSLSFLWMDPLVSSSMADSSMEESNLHIDLSGELQHPSEVLHYKRDGMAFFNLVVFQTIFDETGQPLYFVGVMLDITSLKRVSEDSNMEMSNSGRATDGVYEYSSMPTQDCIEPEERKNGWRKPFSRLQHALSCLLQMALSCMTLSSTMENDFRILCSTDGYQKMTGYSSQELQDGSLKIVQGKSSDSRAIKAVMDSLKKRHALTAEVLHSRKDGVTYMELLHIVPIKDEKRPSIGFIAVHVDISACCDPERIQASSSTAKS